ncbi:GCN5 family N-acetyltransferase [Streptomyces lucensis JCM 4490]|uniref:GCN5 family N-acetyltransferase n=1 Tax=Streptomyces lucensis JCM 4490 TaxID=1306176 RepID=A0A918MSK4_9ACTN|nr:GNAT family N-acetyltransferase [Streptomyces lucensis]GGW66301.1 GCN5 family N-acetyltransferase [Streptomyces lucensis JCM 4490]
MTIRIREGGPDDAPLILGMLDSAVEWLVSQGRTRQWGTESWSGSDRAVELVQRYAAEGTPYFAEIDGTPAATLTLSKGPGPYLEPADEPERYIHLFATDRRFKGLGAGAALLAHAVEVTRRAGISLLRVDCYAGDDGKLVAYYEGNGFIRTEPYTHGEDEWPGQVLARRVL